MKILDPFEEMLQKARQTLDAEEEAVRGRVELVGGNGEDAPRIFGSETFDAVLCHGVLIYLENPDPLIEALSIIARPGAVISILTKNTDALAMRPALEGRYKEALASFDSDRETNRLGSVTRTDTVPELSTKLKSYGIELEQWYGVRVLPTTWTTVPRPGTTRHFGGRVGSWKERSISGSRAAGSPRRAQDSRVRIAAPV